MAEYEVQATDLEDLSGPDSSGARESSPGAISLSLDPGIQASRNGFEWLVLAASVALHVAIAWNLHGKTTPEVTRLVAHKVEIELAPPPPEEPKIKEPEPPPDPTPSLEKPVVQRVQAAAPVAQVASNPDNSGLPSSDEGLLPPTPPGTGEPGPAQVAPPAPPPPPPPPPPPAPVVQAKVGADFARRPNLQYPRLAQREEWEGTVVLRAQILQSGKVGSISVQKSSGHSVLDEAAIAAAKTWNFQPATQGGLPVAGNVTFPVQFKLQ